MSRISCNNYCTYNYIRTASYSCCGAMASFQDLHEAACANNEHSYIDPATGYMVFTEVAHRERGKCCGSGCRHCPFEYENLKETHPLMKPIWLHRYQSSSSSSSSPLLPFSSCGEGRQVKVLFWSGGKDSFLTLRALTRACVSSSSTVDTICLLTTFDARLNIIANQELQIDAVR